MKTVATLAAIAGITMASEFEDDVFVRRPSIPHSTSRVSTLQKDREFLKLLALDEFAENELAVEDFGDDNFSFNLFKKKKKPQPQPQPQPKPTNPDDIVDWEPIHVDLNSDEFFVQEIADNNYGVFDFLKKKKKHPQQPQPQPQPTNPDDMVDWEPIHVDLNSDEFFVEDLGDDNLGLMTWFKPKKTKPTPKPVIVAEPVAEDEHASNEFFKIKIKNPFKHHHHHDEEPQQPVIREIPSDEFFVAAEDLADDSYSFLGLWKKKHPKDPNRFVPRDIQSNEFFAADEIADDSFFKIKIKNPFKRHHHHDEQPQQPVIREIPSDEFFAVDEAADNSLFKIKIKNPFHHHHHHDEQPQQPVIREIPSDEFFAVDEAADNSLFKIKIKNPFHHHHHHDEQPQEPVIREIPSDEFFAHQDVIAGRAKLRPHNVRTFPKNTIHDLANLIKEAH